MPPAPLPHNDPDAEIAEILREAMSARRGEQVAPEPPQQSEAGRGQASVGRIADDAPPKGYGSGAAAPLGIKFEADDQKQSLQRSQLTGRWIAITPRTVMVAILGVGAAILWMRLLAGFSVDAPPPSDAVYEQASLRVAVAIASKRINAFSREYGRTPTILEEVGDQPIERIAYERISNERYRLTASGSTGPVTYDSVMPLDTFLGRSRETLGIMLESIP